MSSGKRPTDFRIQFREPAFQASDDVEAVASQDWQDDGHGSSDRKNQRLRSRPPKLPLSDGSSSQKPPTTPRGSIYLGSYGKAAENSRYSLPGSVDGKSLYGSAAPSPRVSASHPQLQHLLQAVDIQCDTYGLSELRDGFFDASFYRPAKSGSNRDRARDSLPPAFRKHHPLSLRYFLPHQWNEFKGFVQSLRKYSSGLKLFKTFLGFFVAYIICLVPASRDWLGRYNYIMVISAIINHPGRSVGSQIDGLFLTTLGTVAGLGWGSLALYVSTSTASARAGYGGVLATFLILFTAAIAWLRCLFMRFFQAVLCAGIAICYTCLADTSEAVGWRKLFDYGIPWVLGQALCLLIAAFVFPDTGSRPLALAFHESLTIIKRGLDLPHGEDPLLRRDLAWAFVKLSGAVRDFTIDLSISRYRPDDIRSVRNLMQGVIRAILSIRPDATLFDHAIDETISSESESGAGPAGVGISDENQAALEEISRTLAPPTRSMIDAMLDCVKHVEHTLLRLGGVKKFRNGPNDQKALWNAHNRLRVAIDAFDKADAKLIENHELSSAYASQEEIVGNFLFVHPLRQTADKVQTLVEKVLRMQQECSSTWRVWLPSYPFFKSLNRVNWQVRHDRGGLTAGFYFRNKQQLERIMEDLQYTSYVPRARSKVTDVTTDPQTPTSTNSEAGHPISLGDDDEDSHRFQLWQFLHRLQDFESRFAFKVALTTTLISIPAWLQQSRGWWNDYESWWAVVTIWVMMHPRVGGTFQDLWVRSAYAALGAVWAGLGYAAGNGSPYVLAVFAALYMIPTLHRFTQSSHPRSGLVGCLSFTVISLAAYTNHAEPSIVKFAWTRGIAFVVGVVAALLVNWVLWPFVARHELRKSLAAMMLHSAILYRGVVAKYIYYDQNSAPTDDDVARSEMLECRLREGFVRIRQLLELTRHEIRLRAPFDPLPYSGLIDACERFFEHLVQVRQSSLYFQPFMHARGEAATNALFQPRRDAVAVILLNLYTLSVALRSDRPVPRYLPSAAAARQRLLDRMDEVEAELKAAEQEGRVEKVEGKGRRWADVYQYAFSSALTDIVWELRCLQRFTKEICGEIGFESVDEMGN